MNPTIRISLFVFTIAILSFQMTCNNGMTSVNDVVVKPCIDKSKIDTKRGCPRDYRPVCGCDGVTYANSCNAEVNGVTSWNEGECPCINESLVNKEAPCTKEYRPVCGCDNKTYGNECVAKNAGLTKWTKGACPDTGDTNCIDPSKISLRPCPENLDPVCGCDNKTYSNECNAEINGVTTWTKGACCVDPSKVSKRSCPDVYDPVCGCDGKTYGNECEAKNQGLSSWTPGKCDASKACIDPAKINPTQPCTKEYRPVCGCDGKTYGNECEAKKAGLNKWTPGKCNS